MEGHLRAKEVLYDPPASLPYQERTGHLGKRPGLAHLDWARDLETLTGRNLDGQCQGGPEGEKSKTTRIGMRPKTKKEVWRSLVRASSSATPTKKRKEEEEAIVFIIKNDHYNFALLFLLSSLIGYCILQPNQSHLSGQRSNVPRLY